mmetsp:Transcript_26239/g.42976  ORF Transcript_26239/g.42976 Transcript_26239/m.42976 type:complete len:702 (-) Transcript_26239:333-2438(-)
MNGARNNAAESVAERNDETRKSNHMQVVFRDVGFVVKVGKGKARKERVILKNVSGCFQPKRFTAILGASGAGKTTLLNLLSGRSQGGKMEGSVLINGQVTSMSILRKVSGFVFQDDVILDSMTVREALKMSARLRLPRKMSQKEKMGRVDQVIAEMQLEKCADTIVGSSLVKGISGGERKRCALGMEMISQPSILFCDEPTSGLDSFTAFHVVQVLKNLARRGRTVVATLHQPSSEIFHMFDDLVILSEGQVMYFGPANLSVDYFRVHGFPCPQYNNPADFYFMKILNTLPSTSTIDSFEEEEEEEEKGHTVQAKEEDDRGYVKGVNLSEPEKDQVVVPSEAPVANGHGHDVLPNGTTKAEEKDKEEERDVEVGDEDSATRINQLLQEWPESEQGVCMEKIISQPVEGGVNVQAIEKTATMATQFRVLSERSAKNAIRNKLVIRARLGQTLFMALVAGLIYLSVSDNQVGIQNRNGALFFVTVNNFMAPTMMVLTVFGTEKTVFAREYRAGMYNTAAFFLSKVVVELPYQIIFPFVFSVISYWMIGFQKSAEKFFIYATTVILMTNCGAALGIAIAAAFTDLSVALAVAPMLILPLMVFSGFFVNNGGIPVYFNWIKYLSPMKYGFATLIKNEYTGLSLTCSTPPTGQCFTNGNQVIAALGLESPDPGIGESMLIMLSIYLGLLLIAYIALGRVVRQHYSK